MSESVFSRSRIIVVGDGDSMHNALRRPKRWTILRTSSGFAVVRRLSGRASLVVCHLAPAYSFDMANRYGLRVVARILLEIHTSEFRHGLGHA